MKIAIVQFPGSNCERETIAAVQRAGMSAIEFLWNDDPKRLNEMDGFVIVGGFSYEDRSRAGIIAALDPVMHEIRVQSELGKPVLGICNGAQILVETGLVPGLADYQLGVALAENKRIINNTVQGTGFYNTWITMRANAKAPANAFTRHLESNQVLNVPIAHAEGRFIIPDELLEEMSAAGLTVFQYCNPAGEIIDQFPINPNGSAANCAAIMNKAGNVMAMMPHPERTAAGDAIFTSMREYIEQDQKPTCSPLNYSPAALDIRPYKKEASKQELIVQLVITDNYALTVQNTLRQLGIPVSVQRMVHWQIDCKQLALIEQIKKTGVLFNERKEFLVPPFDLQARKAFLVRPKEDILGQQKLHMLHEHFAIQGVTAIHHGTLWIFEGQHGPIDELIPRILKTQIIFNPYAHECYDYE